MNRYTVKITVNGYGARNVRVEAADVETAATMARDIVHAMETKRAAIVAASGGPKWAAEAPAFSALCAVSVRKMGVAA